MISHLVEFHETVSSFYYDLEMVEMQVEMKNYAQ